MKNQEKEIEQLYEQIKVGMTLFETARFNSDKKVALPLAKQGLSLVAEAAKAFLDDPDLCPPYRKFPHKGPKREELIIDNPLSDPDPGFRNVEVLGILENLRGNAISPILKASLKEVSKTTLEAVSI